MSDVIRFAVTLIATWLIVGLLLTLYEGSTAEGYRSLDSKTTRIVVFAGVVALWLAVMVVATGIPYPTFK